MPLRCFNPELTGDGETIKEKRKKEKKVGRYQMAHFKAIDNMAVQGLWSPVQGLAVLRYQVRSIRFALIEAAASSGIGEKRWGVKATESRQALLTARTT